MLAEEFSVPRPRAARRYSIKLNIENHAIHSVNRAKGKPGKNVKLITSYNR